MQKCIACHSEKWTTLVDSKDFCVSQEDFTISKCQNCGFAYTVDAPNQKEIGKYYEHDDYISHTDTKQGLFFSIYHRVRDYMLSQKQAYLSKNGVSNDVLDIGSGTGYFVNQLKQNDWNVVGVEPDKGARQQAKKNFDIDLETNIDDIVNRQQQFQAISMWHVLEHVHDLTHYFTSFRALLKPKGKLVIAVPNYTSYDAKVYKKYWAAYDLPKHLWHFSPESLKQLAQQYQFTFKTAYDMPFDPFYIALLSAGHQKAGVFGKLKALFVGFISFIKGKMNTEKASSVVYVFEKQGE